jgi:hypothetical protein
MSANETVHTSASGGQKAGNDERYDLIPTEPLRRLALHAGIAVYGPRPGSFARMMSHAWAFWAGEEMDEACDWPHLMAAAWEAMRIVDPSRPPQWVIDDRRPGVARYDRIPADALRQLAKHFGVGARKYDDDNWLRGYDWRLSFAAANRHAEQFRAGETHDPETGSHHLIAFAWHMLVLDEFTRWYPQYDTRTATKRRLWIAAAQQHEAAVALEPIPDIVSASLAYAGSAPRRRLRRGVAPRTIGPDDKQHHWIDNEGDRWQWVDDDLGAGYAIWHTYLNRFSTARAQSIGGELGPFTEAAPAPRVATELTEAHKDAQWLDNMGVRSRWIWVGNEDCAAGWAIMTRLRPDCHTPPPYAPTVDVFGPFTEVLPDVVDEITEAHKDRDWVDRDGDRWHWVDDSLGTGYALALSDGTHSSGRLPEVDRYGPYTEAL